ncbi:hypothetical protein CCR75_006026 [Bremia lactucae]|uniref:non-specific serine/threonine protein kinase n=1 Tax=Bremia lactucae TaxID=4779 RepID=A0A976IDF5_BRELC|nr:hypothetical protein CCR75_006026 [Bremia lactucae]
MAASLYRSSDDRRSRRSHRAHSHSPSASRTHPSSYHRSSHRRFSRKRSKSRSRSRDRSRRSSRHRPNHRSRSGERHKRHRRNSHEKRAKRRSHSKSRIKTASKNEEIKQRDKRSLTRSSAHSSQDSEAVEEVVDTLTVQVLSNNLSSEEPVCKVQKTEVQQTQTTIKIAAFEQKDEVPAVDTDKQINNSICAEKITDLSPILPKQVLDVSTIKADVLKALADARSTIAVIKKNGGSTFVATTPTIPSLVESTEVQTVATLQEKEHDSVIQVPQKTSLSPETIVSGTDELDMFSMAALDDHNDTMNGSNDVATVTVDKAALQSNCDDAEGYYSTTIGEVLHDKYRVLGAVGKGVFSTVLRCQCITSSEKASGGVLHSVVAIKVIRNNDVMREAAQNELRILRELSERDSRDKKHCIKLLDSFTHRNHVAIVFEPMQMNVREAMKKFGGKGGISLQAVRVFSKHLLIALSHLEACCIIHADIKPDNMVLDEKQTTIKLCDFGSAFKAEAGKQDPTPYLVSRFYRAPEIILGLAYDKAVDMWSVGCCLYEMFTGKVLFPGSTNNEMLKFFMEVQGKIPNKLIKKHRQTYLEQFAMEPHFTEDLKFCSRESDRVTGKPLLRFMGTIKITNDLASSLMNAKSLMDDRKRILELSNLLSRMITLDPSKRISVKDALAHPFVKGS